MEERGFALPLARAGAGALLFALPLLMTQEMWEIGFYMEPLRLAVFLAVGLPLLAGLAYFSGFREDLAWPDAVIDAFVAFAVGAGVAFLLLAVLGVLASPASLEEIVRKVALQAVPAGMGATLAQTQLGQQRGSPERRREGTGYAGELFLMAAGALFLAFNVAPTEEVVLLSYKMSHLHAFLLVPLTLIVMHGFVYGVGFAGQRRRPEKASLLAEVVRFTIGGYAAALLVSLFVLWVFQRTDGLGVDLLVVTTVVLAFPAAIGAAAARLIL
ncbi:TIGR02587 family membrane protein [Marinimicrococcus flavescens]|uniref:TIGR02587 family membrane protein n=1 Tax=Marinimicrococcus flavescens TaxID=3031815 RepID=A0AAP3V090_9PROT|nr:TIGR02587 family membrane protein [Marinimicrococcus flavescens]